MDVILGMDWLSKYNTAIDCQRKIMNFAPPGELPFTLNSLVTFPLLPVISTMTARKLIKKGCQGYLAAVTDIAEQSTLKLEDIDVV